MDPVRMLIDDHRKVQGLFRQYESLPEPTNWARKSGAQEALTELEMHSKLEEEIFYPALRAKASGALQELLQESFEEHHEIDGLIDQLKALDPASTEFDEKFRQVIQMVSEHIEEEETDMLPKAQATLGADYEGIGDQMMKLKRQLQQQSREAA